MSAQFRVLADHKWTTGVPRAIASLHDDPDRLAKRLRVKFQEDSDDLDRFRQVYLRLPSGRVVVLRRHVRNPVPGTAVYAEAKDSPSDALTELLEATGLSAKDVSWTPPTDT